VTSSGGTVALADRGWRQTGPVTAPGTTSVFAGFRFPREVISPPVRWYLRYGLSYRDVEELLAERGVTVDHGTVYRWVQRFTPEFTEAARPCRHAPGDRWFVDETYLKVAGKWTYLCRAVLCRAVDQHGQVIDVLLAARRDLAAAAGRCRSGARGDDLDSAAEAELQPTLISLNGAIRVLLNGVQGPMKQFVGHPRAPALAP